MNNSTKIAIGVGITFLALVLAFLLGRPTQTTSTQQARAYPQQPNKPLPKTKNPPRSSQAASKPAYIQNTEPYQPSTASIPAPPQNSSIPGQDTTEPTAAILSPEPSLTVDSPISPIADNQPLAIDSQTTFKPSTPNSNPASKQLYPPKPYVVQTGDTFISISVAEYGIEDHWLKIAQMNPLVDPTKLEVGQVIMLPDPQQAFAVNPLSQTFDPNKTVIHIVKSNETLSSISKSYYGSTQLWGLIYNNNRSTIGYDPDHVPAGTALKIPPIPSLAGTP